MKRNNAPLVRSGRRLNRSQALCEQLDAGFSALVSRNKPYSNTIVSRNNQNSNGIVSRNDPNSKVPDPAARNNQNRSVSHRHTQTNSDYRTKVWSESNPFNRFNAATKPTTAKATTNEATAKKDKKTVGAAKTAEAKAVVKKVLLVEH